MKYYSTKELYIYLVEKGAKRLTIGEFSELKYLVWIPNA
jgi:hypothetical protein